MNDRADEQPDCYPNQRYRQSQLDGASEFTENGLTPLKEIAMARAVAKSFKQHPVKLAVGLIINVGGVLALAAHF